MINETSNVVKTSIDAGAGLITIGAVLKWIPEVTAVLSLVWVAIRLWETDTLKRLFNRKCSTNKKEDK